MVSQQTNTLREYIECNVGTQVPPFDRAIGIFTHWVADEFSNPPFVQNAYPTRKEDTINGNRYLQQLDLDERLRHSLHVASRAVSDQQEKHFALDGTQLHFANLTFRRIFGTILHASGLSQTQLQEAAMEFKPEDTKSVKDHLSGLQGNIAETSRKISAAKTAAARAANNPNLQAVEIPALIKPETVFAAARLCVDFLVATDLPHNILPVPGEGQPLIFDIRIREMLSGAPLPE